MSSIFAPCRHCEGRGSHEVWGLSAAEPVRSFTCTFCHGAGLIAPAARPMATVHDLVAARDLLARNATAGITVGARCLGFEGGMRGAA